MRILIVDDDHDIVDLLAIYSRKEGYEVLKAYDGQQALDKINQLGDLIDIVILDWMLPEVNGIDVLKTIRAQGNKVPVIMASAKTESNHRLEGLMAGADDYVSKPFDAREVMIRIKGIARRMQPEDQSEETIEIGPLIINRKQHQVKTLAGVEIQLTSLEFDILTLLATHPGEVFSAEMILHEVWGNQAKVNAKTVMVHVSHLRDKIDQATGGNKLIETVWGVGYKIEG